MDFESKIISREVSEILWDTEKTVGTAESCTGGRIAEAIISVPGASKYFKGGIICYVNEIKENLLGVDPQVLEEKTAVSFNFILSHFNFSFQKYFLFFL